jgi:hypothetical protein
MNCDNWFQPPFIPIPPSLYDKGNGLNAAAIAVWGALARWVTDSDGHCWRPIRLLAQDTKLSEATVQRAIGTLKKAGWLKVTLHRGAHSTYRLIWGGSTAMSMQTTRKSDITQTSLLNITAVKPAQQREKDGKWHHTDVTSDITQRSDLYSLSILREEKERAFTDPLFSSTQKQGKGKSNQDKEQANQDPKQSKVIPQHISLDEGYRLEQERLREQKKPGGKA